ncbi:testis-expressed protein 11-like [Babylonia areolata]|uniref:testis-expressed protein 11-like n=1 Tax=Babylonia areolata TaxID=304850 RepID=UPI003FD5AA2C
MVQHQHGQHVADNNNLICLAAQMALEQKRESLAAMALSSVVDHMADSFQVLKALRCLVRLHTAPMAAPDHSLTRQTIEEILSYIRTAWNVALKCEEDPVHMKEFFMLCYRLVSLCEEDSASTVGHKRTCVLMATAACVQIARPTSDRHEKKALLEEALHFISEYKSLDSKLTDGGIADTEKRRPTQILMLLYEFEALTKLGDPKAESVLERALVLPNPEPKLFESIAALAVDSPARQSRLSMRALKVAIHTHLQYEEPDFLKCSKDIHQLIEQSLTCYEEEAFAYFKETADILDKKAQARSVPTDGGGVADDKVLEHRHQALLVGYFHPSAVPEVLGHTAVSKDLPAGVDFKLWKRCGSPLSPLVEGKAGLDKRQRQAPTADWLRRRVKGPHKPSAAAGMRVFFFFSSEPQFFTAATRLKRSVLCGSWLQSAFNPFSCSTQVVCVDGRGEMALQ